MLRLQPILKKSTSFLWFLTLLTHSKGRKCWSPLKLCKMSLLEYHVDLRNCLTVWCLWEQLNLWKKDTSRPMNHSLLSAKTTSLSIKNRVRINTIVRAMTNQKRSQLRTKKEKLLAIHATKLPSFPIKITLLPQRSLQSYRKTTKLFSKKKNFLTHSFRLQSFSTTKTKKMVEKVWLLPLGLIDLLVLET